MTQSSPLRHAAPGHDHGFLQSRLAQTLVQRLGHDEAVNACRANSWHGVLAMVLDLREIAGVPTAH